MTEFAKAKEVHSILARLWGSSLKAAGFKRVKPGACAFARPRGDSNRFVTLAVQISQFGDSWSGNQFTLNADGAAALPEDYAITVFRPLEWLTAADCEEGLELERRLRERFPMPSREHPVWLWAKEPGNSGEIFRKALGSIKKVREDLWKPGRDVWLPYFSSEDVVLWGNYLLPRIPALIARAESESTSRADA